MSLSKPEASVSSYKKGRGLCIYICNVVFGKNIGTGYSNESIQDGRFRAGAGIDTANISRALAYIDMEYQYYENKTAKEILDILQDARKLVDDEKDKYSSLMILISTHGERGTLYGTDEVQINEELEIINPFHNSECMGLRGKPKVFLFNACR